jgi:leucyl-tRNA synthetase
MDDQAPPFRYDARLAPLAPHVAEELWQRLGHAATLAYKPFPQPDPALAADDTTTLPVQVNGKVRFTIEVPASASQDEITELAASHPGYPKDEVARLVVVPGQGRQHRPAVSARLRPG